MSCEPVQTSRSKNKNSVRLSSVAILFIATVATVVGLIGIAKGETSPWVLLAPLAASTYAILTITTTLKGKR